MFTYQVIAFLLLILTFYHCPMHRSLACIFTCQIIGEYLHLPDYLRFPYVFSLEVIPPHYALLQIFYIIAFYCFSYEQEYVHGDPFLLFAFLRYHSLYYQWKSASLIFWQVSVMKNTWSVSQFSRPFSNVVLEKSHTIANGFIDRFRPCSCIWDEMVHHLLHFLRTSSR